QRQSGTTARLDVSVCLSRLRTKAKAVFVLCSVRLKLARRGFSIFWEIAIGGGVSPAEAFMQASENDGATAMNMIPTLFESRSLANQGVHCSKRKVSRMKPEKNEPRSQGRINRSAV